MAKSLRSKWKRKMRAIKRERYGVKELAKLNMIVEASKKATETSDDIEMADVETLIKYVPKFRPRMARRKDSFTAKPVAPSTSTDEPMETNKSDSNNPKFPIWVGSHRRKKIIARNKLISKQKKKEIKKAQKKRR